jgi:uroporphyrinogen decarboxylase
MKAALERRQPSSAVPVWEIEFHLWDQLSPIRMVLGKEFQALSRSEQERALHTNAEVMVAVSLDVGFAAVSTPNAYWEIAPGEPAYFWLPGEARFRQIDILRRLSEERLILVGESGGVICMPGAGEYVEFSYKLYDAPEEIDEMARRNLRHGEELAKRLCDLGVEILFTASDIADNHGPFFAAEQMERFILPYLHQWGESVRSLGAYSVLHSDGHLGPYLQQLADSGIDALQAIDPIAGMDMRAVKDQVGNRLCLCGNVDCGLLVTAEPEEVYAATRGLLLDCKAGGGLVLGASNAVQPETPVENYRAMIQAWRTFGKY